MRKVVAGALLAMFAVGCTTTGGDTPEPTPVPEPQPEPEPQPVPKPDPCTVFEESIKLQFHESDGSRGTYLLGLPATGPVAHEGHYIVPGKDPEGLGSVTDRIGPHLIRECALLRGAWGKFFPELTAGCSEVFKKGGWSEWTPAEPTIGHGSRPFPSLECEAATANMFWASGAAPKPGTRFIAQRGGRAMVLCMGYEAGPGSKKMIGGLGSPALYYLRGAHGSTVTLGRAVDQTLPYGPIECAK